MRKVRQIGQSLRRRGVPRLAIVVPCYNEEDVLSHTFASLRSLLSDLRKDGLAGSDSYICCVDDGSRDRTWDMIEAMSARHEAVLAGMLECAVDAVVTIDADLQDDERCIAEMLRRYRDGYYVVLGVRSDRSTDTGFKRFTAELRALHAAGVRIVFNHADFRLLSCEALAILREFRESNLFLRGLIPLIGLPSAIVEYARKERLAGESKYPLKKMLALAWEGVTSLSIMPLRAVAAIGAVISVGSLAFP
jgi:glycosyltransferase involved in cell wall biosynthesis